MLDKETKGTDKDMLHIINLDNRARFRMLGLLTRYLMVMKYSTAKKLNQHII